jgi:hypothetical protein
MTGLEWWGYLHANGDIQVKRYLGDPRDYTTDCDGNPFVLAVCEPFEAHSREEALTHIRQELTRRGVQAPKRTGSFEDYSRNFPHAPDPRD